MSTAHVKPEVEEVILDLIGRISSLSEIELNTRPAPGKWSPGQIAEHLLKSYRIAATISGPTSETQRAADEKVAEIKGIFLNFDTKFESPEFILPSESYINKDTLVTGLNESKSLISNAADCEDLTLTCTSFEFPGSGYMTRLEWLRFIQYHTQRHLIQLENTIKTIKQNDTSTSENTLSSI